MTLRWSRGNYSHQRAQIRAVLWEKSGGICMLCRGPIDVADVHADHIIPQKHGGSSDLDNLQAAHRRCNSAKGSRDAMPAEIGHRDPLIHLALDESFIERIDDFRFANRFPSRTAAMAWLMQAALDAGLKPQPSRN